MRRGLLFLLLIFSAVTGFAQTRKVNHIGPYTLGTPFTELQNLPGFEYDTVRSKPAMGVRVGRVIDKNVFNMLTVQRLTCHKGKLVRISIIIADPEFTEEQAKALVADQWGAPVLSDSGFGKPTLTWKGSAGTIYLLPADGNRKMITLTDN